LSNKKYKLFLKGNIFHIFNVAFLPEMPFYFTKLHEIQAPHIKEQPLAQKPQ